MFSPQFGVMFSLLVIVHVVVAIFLTKEIFSWIIELKQRLVLTVFVWCIPFIGAFFTYRKIGSDLYGSSGNLSSGASSGVSANLVGLDEIFNPNTKHVIEIHQEEQGEVREDDEPYKGKSFEEIVITKNIKNDSGNA